MKTLARVLLLLALLLAAGPALAEVQQRTLLASDGTLYKVSTGLASELALENADPDDFAVVWTSVAQDGTQAGGVIPGAVGSSPKTSLDLTVDEPTGTLVVLWREEISLVNKIRLAFGKAGAWTLADLLPTAGFPRAYNPQMLLTHQVVHTLDENDADVFHNRSILSIIWWEEAGVAQARYASFFLDEAIDSPVVYDLPVLVSDPGPTSLQDIPRAAYAYPSLQAEGPGGGVLASFAALFSSKHYVVKIGYPTELGKPAIDNMTWQRRRIPVVGIASQGPMAAMPSFEPSGASVTTVIGSSLKPTMHWREEGVLRYIRFDGALWSEPRTIALTEEMTYDKAVALVQGMAQRN